MTSWRSNKRLSKGEKKDWVGVMRSFEAEPFEKEFIVVPFDPVTETLPDLLERIDTRRTDGLMSEEDYHRALDVIDIAARSDNSQDVLKVFPYSETSAGLEIVLEFPGSDEAK